MKSGYGLGSKFIPGSPLIIYRLKPSLTSMRSDWLSTLFRDGISDGVCWIVDG